MVGRLWGVLQVVELGRACLMGNGGEVWRFFCGGCCAVPCFRQGQTPGGV